MTEDKKDQAQNPVDDQDIIEGEIVEEGSEGTPAAESAVSEADYNRLAEDLDKSMAQAKEYFEGWQRERADFANYKRRVDRDSQTLSQNIKGDVIKKYLPILDDLDRAMKNRPSDEADQNWVNGIELIYRKLQNILEAEGVKRIPAEDEEFNPSRHEAITYEDSPDHESGQVIEVVQQGYTLGDRVLRPALVRVAR